MVFQFVSCVVYAPGEMHCQSENKPLTDDISSSAAAAALRVGRVQLETESNVAAAYWSLTLPRFHKQASLWNFVSSSGSLNQ